MIDRPLDHLVLCVNDLDAARAHYARLGFTLTPRAVHPFGTANSLIQLHGNFLEIVGIADPALIRPTDAENFSFADFCRSYLARREGMAMLVFASDDARRDQAQFAASGLETYAPFDFERRAQLPDGSAVTVGFSLAFVTDRRLPNAAFFVCQQRAPQHFWKAEYQRHRNTARTVDEVVMVAPEPAALEELMTRLQPDGRIRRDGTGLAVETARGRVVVLDRRAYGDRFEEPAADATPHFAACRIAVDDLAPAAAALREGGIAHRAGSGRLIVPAAANCGIALELATTSTP
jgi:hypothetical protein